MTVCLYFSGDGVLLVARCSRICRFVVFGSLPIRYKVVYLFLQLCIRFSFIVSVITFVMYSCCICDLVRSLYLSVVRYVYPFRC